MFNHAQIHASDINKIQNTQLFPSVTFHHKSSLSIVTDKLPSFTNHIIITSSTKPQHNQCYNMWFANSFPTLPNTIRNGRDGN